MPEILFASRSLYRTLAMFFDYPADTLFPRLIARRTGVDIKSVFRALRKLEEAGVVRRGAGRRGREYRVDEGYPIADELAGIFLKTRARRRYR